MSGDDDRIEELQMLLQRMGRMSDRLQRSIGFSGDNWHALDLALDAAGRIVRELAWEHGAVLPAKQRPLNL